VFRAKSTGEVEREEFKEGRMFAEARGLPAIMGGTKGYCRTAGLKARPALHVLLDVPEVAGV
jgi:hypothetical protein